MNLWRKINKGCVLLIAMPLLILLGLLLLADRISGGSIKPSLDAQYVPTAEYLLQHPQPIPSLIIVHPEPSTLLASSGTVSIGAFLNDKIYSLSQWSQLFINNQKVSIDDIDVAFEYPDIHSKKEVYVQYFYFYLYQRLDPGLHLFRIQIASSFGEFLNPDPNLSYEWAYRVE